jgi:hypothetical protein
MIVSDELCGPQTIVSIGMGAIYVANHRLPEDVQIVEQTFDKTHNRWELLLHSEQFEPIHTLRTPPLLDPPVIGPPDGGDPDVLRRKMKLRERRRDS